MKNQIPVNIHNQQTLTNRLNQDFSPVHLSNHAVPHVFISLPSSDLVYQSQIEFDQSNTKPDSSTEAQINSIDKGDDVVLAHQLTQTNDTVNNSNQVR